MQIIYTEAFKDSGRRISQYFEEVDLYEGTKLSQEFPDVLDNTVHYVSEFPEASAKHKKGTSRNCTRKKFKSHYVLYNYNIKAKSILLIEVRGYKQKF
jgi:hypothetical protein